MVFRDWGMFLLFFCTIIYCLFEGENTGLMYQLVSAGGIIMQILLLRFGF